MLNIGPEPTNTRRSNRKERVMNWGRIEGYWKRVVDEVKEK
jgi:hypothetical protein